MLILQKTGLFLLAVFINWIVLCAQANSAPGADPLNSSNSAFANNGTTNANNDFSGQTIFLPVDEAYQLTLNTGSAFEQEGRIGIEWTIAAGYYLYWERMAITATAQGKPLPLVIEHTAGIQKYDDLFERDTEVFYQQALLTAALDQSKLQQPLPASYTLSVEYQGCADAGLCYPPRTRNFQIDTTTGTTAETDTAIESTSPQAPAVKTAPAETTTTQPATSDDQHTLAWALLMALLGGLILNLMPCVFPVLSLKIFAMAGHGDHSAAVRKQSWIYLLGVVLSFILVAGIMLALRAGGESVGWGFQLQEPLFISLLVYLFFVLGLSFSGVVHIGGSLMGIGQSLVAGSGYRSAFFTGVLAVIVASPCSVPFMGVAVGYAIGQSATAALTIFAVLGAGMALPFVLLAYWPQMLRRLPAPGAWMDRLKQFLAFPLYATCLWLLYVLGEQGGHMAILWVLGGLILLVMAGWLWRDADAHPSEKLFAILILLCALVLPHFLVVQICSNGDASIVRPSKSEYEPYSAIRLEELRAEGKPVFVNLTAAWCITCLVNEKVALDHDAVKIHMQQNNITYLKGDWTNRDPEITKLLQQFDRSGVPLYLYFPAGKDSSVTVLPQVLTQSTVIEALR